MTSPASTAPIRVVIADDAPLIRHAIAGLLEGGGIEVVAQVDRPETLHAAVRVHRPDLAVVDIRMPPTHRLEGLESAVLLRQDHPGLGILLLSQHLQPQYLHRLVAGGAGGTGYLLKERAGSVASFLQAIHTVADGGCAFDPEVVMAMVSSAAAAEALAALSPRETQVLQLMAEGWSNRAVCERLSMGEKTVESHVRRIFQRLDIPDQPDLNRRVQAVLAYLRAGGDDDGRRS